MSKSAVNSVFKHFFETPDIKTKTTFKYYLSNVIEKLIILLIKCKYQMKNNKRKTS